MVTKYINKLGLIPFILMAVFQGCIKNTVSIEYRGTKPKTDILQSKSVVKKGEPLLVSANAPDSNSLVRWSIRPSDSTLILPDGNTATISITLPGSYLITASYFSLSDTSRAYDSSYTTVIVNDSLFVPAAPGSDLDSIPLSGDQLTLIPFIYGTDILMVQVKTRGLYNCSPYITAYRTGMNSGTSIFIDFSFAEVIQGSGDCGGIKNNATANADFSANSLSPGVYDFNVTFNQVVYLGSLNVTDSNYTFTWNYTSGIIISPLQIKKK